MAISPTDVLARAPQYAVSSQRENLTHKDDPSWGQKVLRITTEILLSPIRLTGQLINLVLPIGRIVDAVTYPGWSTNEKITPQKNRRIFRQTLLAANDSEHVSIPVRAYLYGPIQNPIKTINLDGVYLKSTDHPTAKTVLFCCPNADHYETNNTLAKFYTEKMGYNVLLFNYRGFGDSQGVPTPQRTLRDMESICAWLKREKGIEDSDILVHGRSLGASHAAYLASNHPNMSLVCDRGFRSLPDAAGSMVKSRIRLLKNTLGAIIYGLTWFFCANRLSTQYYLDATKGPKLTVADHKDQQFENVKSSGDILELNSNYQGNSHNDLELTLDSPLFQEWLQKNFRKANQ